MNMLPAMDVINKLYNTVSQTVTQIQYALPGNAVTKDYEVFEHIASAGPGLLWKVYNGSKKTTKQPVSVFVLEKKSLDRWPRADREAILETLRSGVQQLTKLRHPRCLTVQHPLEESRDSLAFATEPVFASLANVLGDRANAPETSAALRSFVLHEVEIKAGVLQLCEALRFLHEDARLLHRNVCPRAVVVNKEGQWKLFGFEYCAAAVLTTAAAPGSDNASWSCRPYNQAAHPLLQPQLDYMAPEHVCLDRNEPASDMFSLATLLFTLHSADHRPPKQFRDDVDAYRRYATDLEHGAYPNMVGVPAPVADHVRASLNARPAARPTCAEVERLAWLCDDQRVTTLTQLSTAFQWTNLQKSQFYKSLPTTLQAAAFPARILLQHVLPPLVREFAHAAMVPFVLPSFLHIAAACSAAEYAQHCHPALRPVLRQPEPIQTLLILVQHIELLLRQTPAAELQSDVLPMLYRALETDQPQMQQMCLSILPAFAKTVDQTVVRTGILPRLRALCTKAATPAQLVVNALVCLGHLLDYMDRWLVMDEVVPLLVVQMRGARDPPVIMAMVAILRKVLDSKRLGVTREVMATKLVPFLMPLCVESGLAVAEFEVVMAMVHELVAQVEREQRERLEQLRGQQTKGQGMGGVGVVQSPVTGQKQQPFAPMSPMSPMSTTTLTPSSSSVTPPSSFGSRTTGFSPTDTPPAATTNWAPPKSTPPTSQQQQQQQRPNYNIDSSSSNAMSMNLVVSGGSMGSLSLSSPPSQPQLQPRNLTATLNNAASPPSAMSANTFQSNSAAWTQRPALMMGGSSAASPAAPMNQQASMPTMMMMQPTNQTGRPTNGGGSASAQLTQQDILDFLN